MELTQVCVQWWALYRQCSAFFFFYQSVLLVRLVVLGEDKGQTQFFFPLPLTKRMVVLSHAYRLVKVIIVQIYHWIGPFMMASFGVYIPLNYLTSY